MMMIATVTSAFITASGRSAWFVGALMIFTYAVFALALYVVPPAKDDGLCRVGLGLLVSPGEWMARPRRGRRQMGGK